MADPVADTSTETPPDPEMLRLQARVRALMLIGGLTLAIGLVAVFAAIIYRVVTPSDKGSASVAEASAAPAASEAAAPAASEMPPAPAVSETPVAPAPTNPAVARAVEVVKTVLPVRAWLVSAAVSGDRIVLAYEHAGGTTMFVVDAVTLEITGRLDLKPQSQ